jgi:hypothetical protein
VCPDYWGARKPPAVEDDPWEDEASLTSSRSHERDDVSLASSRGRDQGEEASHASSREEAEEERVEVERVEVEEREERTSAMKKRTNTLVCDEFVVVEGSFSDGGTFQCRHCEGRQEYVWKRRNSSKARSHLERCVDVPRDVRIRVKTTGYISVERVAKPLKNKVTEKGRNRNSTAKRALLLRCGVNLRLKKESLRSVKAALGKLDPDDPLVYE